MSLTKFSSTLQDLGCQVEIEASKLLIDIDESKFLISVDDDWEKTINGFYRARQYEFNEESRILTANKFVEFQLTRLSPDYFQRPDFEFTNKREERVTLKKPSYIYMLSIYSSKLYSDFFESTKRRVKRRYKLRMKGKTRDRLRMPIEDLLLSPYTATFFPKRKLPKDKLISVGREKIKGCLFSLAYSKNECWEIIDDIKTGPLYYVEPVSEDDQLYIPAVKYEEDLVSYYKVAKSSQFPSQAFLSYYHILEYNFLRVTDEILFNSVKAQLNRPNFRATYDNVNKLLAVVKKHHKTHDETEMLKAVLSKYVPEEELIDFLMGLEDNIGDKIYSQSKETIFGEKMNIRIEPGHALSNSAKIIKHIRNSLVHSSDRYNREDCFIPFSETESTIMQYIPIVKYLAEKVLFSTAT